MIPARCADPSRLFVGIDVSWWCMVAFSIVCKPTDDPTVKCLEMRPILYGWLAALFGGIRPAFVAAFLDSVGPTWRHAETRHLPIEQRYKANRTKRPKEFYNEINGLIEVLRLHGIPCYRAEGWEADDVAATVTARARAAGLDVALVTLDHDWRALVRDRDASGGEVYCWSYGRRDATTIGPAEMRASKGHGLDPRLMPDMIALCGDGDNIAGVKGLGATRARIVLERWGSVPSILAASPGDMSALETTVVFAEKARDRAVRALGKTAQAQGEDLLDASTAASRALDAARLDVGAEKIRRAIVEKREAVELGLLLATLDPFAPLDPPFDLTACAVGGLDVPALTRLYTSLGFTVMAGDVASSSEAA